MEPVNQTFLSHEPFKKELRVLLINENLMQLKLNIEQNMDGRANIECRWDRCLDLKSTSINSDNLMVVIKSQELDIKSEDETDLRMEENINEETNCSYHCDPKNCVISCQKNIYSTFGEYSCQSSSHTNNAHRRENKQFCPYCKKDIFQFARHLQRHHKKEEVVKSIMSLSLSDPRRKLLYSSLRKQANFVVTKRDSVVRPVRKKPPLKIDNTKPAHVACVYCLGYYNRKYLARHVRACALRTYEQKRSATFQRQSKKMSHLTRGQILEICSDQRLKPFYETLQLTEEVFPIMRNDNISRVAMSDVVICYFGDTQLKKMHTRKTKNAITVVSNRIRVMGRLLIALRENCGTECLFDALTSNCFVNIVEATEEICKYDRDEKKFRLLGLASNIRSYLRIICEMVGKLISDNFPFLPCDNITQRLKDLRQLRALTLEWKIFYSDLPLRSSIEENCLKEDSILKLTSDVMLINSIEKNCQKDDSMLKLTSDVMLMNYLVGKEANRYYEELYKNSDNKEMFVELQRCCFVLLAVLNRHEVNTLQEINLEHYLQHCYTITSADIQEDLSEVEKILLKTYKRIPNLNKAEQQGHVLISADLLRYTSLLVKLRSNFTKNINPFLFITINTDSCLDGMSAINTTDKNLELNCSQALSNLDSKKFVSLVTHIQSLKDDAFRQLCALLESKDTQTTVKKYSRKEPRCIADLVKRILSSQNATPEDSTENETLISPKTAIKKSPGKVLNNYVKNKDPLTPRKMEQHWTATLFCSKESMCSNSIELKETEETNSDLQGFKKCSEEKSVAIKSEELNIKVEEDYVEDSGLEDCMNEDDFSDNQDKPTNASISCEHVDTKPDLSVEKYSVNIDELKKDSTKPNLKRKRKRSNNLKHFCQFCMGQVTNYFRHLKRRHNKEAKVKAVLNLPQNDPKRKVLLSNLHRQANHTFRQKNIANLPVSTLAVHQENYKPTVMVCEFCLGNFSRTYLKRHRKKCALQQCGEEMAATTWTQGKINHLSEVQIFEICKDKTFYATLEILKEVFPIMCNDYVSKVAMSDVVICCFGDRQWRNIKKHKRRTFVSNKMRDLGRLLIALRKSCKEGCLFDFLLPKYFDKIREATEAICAYDTEKQTFKVPSLASHMRSHLKYTCEMVSELILENYSFLPCDNVEQRVKDLYELECLIRDWKITCLPSTSKTTTQEDFECDENLLELTSNILQMNYLVRKEAKYYFEKLKEKKHDLEMFVKLQRCCFLLLATSNGHDISKLQEIDFKKYLHHSFSVSYEDTQKNLTDVEKILLKTYKKVPDLFKAEQQEPVLVSDDLLKYLTYLIALRSNFLKQNNPYLFVTINDGSYLDGISAVNKIAEDLELPSLDAVTDNKLKKYVSLVTHIQQLTADEFGQLCFLVGFADCQQDFMRYAEEPQWIAVTAKHILASQNKSTKDDDVFNVLVKKERISHNSRDLKRKKRITRERWSEEHKKLTEEYFKWHIEKHKPPTRSEVENFKQLHPSLKNKEWEKIKAFVYNVYMKLQYERDSDSTVNSSNMQEPECIIEEANDSQDNRLEDKSHLLNFGLGSTKPVIKSEYKSMDDQDDVPLASRNKSVDNQEDAFEESQNRSVNDQEESIEAGQNRSSDGWENESKVFADTSENKNVDNKITVERRKRKISKERWSKEHKKLTEEYFKNHIRKKKAPNRIECEKFRELYPEIKSKDWLKIKAFVYNVYTKLNRTETENDDSEYDESFDERHPVADVTRPSITDLARHPIKKEEKIEKQVRDRWSQEHKRLTKTYFRDHIKKKKAPTEAECEAFKELHPELKNKHWVKIKVLIYNVYRNNYSK